MGADDQSRDPEAGPTPEVPIVLLNSFQDHPQLHGRLYSNVHERLPNDLHGRHSFQDPEESTNFVRKTFHTIYRQSQCHV